MEKALVLDQCVGLPKEALEEFKVIYKKHFGVDLCDGEASFRANNLLNFYKAVLDGKKSVRR
jgi:hypothetical protein